MPQREYRAHAFVAQSGVLVASQEIRRPPSGLGLPEPSSALDGDSKVNPCC